MLDDTVSAESDEDQADESCEVDVDRLHGFERCASHSDKLVNEIKNDNNQNYQQ